MSRIKILLVIVISVFTNTESVFGQYGVTSEDSLSITQQLNVIFGKDYAAIQIINVDSVENIFNWKFGRINDPYSTLNNCLLFGASEKLSNYEYGKSIVGIYKNNQIIWYSDFIPSDYKFNKIYATIDLTKNGIVEILTEWQGSIGAINPSSYLWIFDWDGITGKSVTKLDNLNESFIWTHPYGGFEFIDIEGDGIWEIIGYDMAEGDSLVPNVFSWDGEKYGVWNNTSTIGTTEMFFPRNNFAATVIAKVIKKDGNNYKYSYIVKNGAYSSQFINEFDVYGSTDSVSNIIKPNRWDGFNLGSEISWEDSIGYDIDIFTMKYQIKPGNGLDNFTYDTYGLPIISKTYLRGFNYNLYQGDENYTKVDDYLNNSVIVTTVAASDPPSPFIPINFLDTLINYTDSSYSLGWITNQTTANKYDSLFTSAKTQLQQNNNNAAKTTLQTVLQEVDIDSTNNLTSEAYALLRYNTEYLIEHLSE